jgi:hypothetical protein
MRFLFLPVLFCCLFACQDNPPVKRSDSVARALCTCSAQLLELNKQAANATGVIDFERIQRAFDEARTCIALQKIKPEEMPEVEKALELLCPELAKEHTLLEELIGG